MWYYPLSGLINGLTLTVLGFFVFFRNRKALPNITYGIFCFFISFWSYSYFFWQISKTSVSAFFWCQMLMLGAIFVPAAYFHFILTFIKQHQNKATIKYVYIAYCVAGIFSILDFTPLMIVDVRPRLKFPFWPTAGPLYIYFLIYFAIFATYGCFLLLREAKHATGIIRNQLFYIFIGSLIGYAGGATNFPLWYDIKIYPVGNILSSIYVGLIGYAIVKFRLMDIKVVLTRAGIFILVYSLLLLAPFVVANYFQVDLFRLFGNNWWVPILVIGMILSSLGPFTYQKLRKKAEDIILKDQRRYQRAVIDLAKALGRIRNLDELLRTIAVIVAAKVRVTCTAIYLKDEHYNSYHLKYHHPKKAKENFQECIPLDHPLVRLLNERKRPILSDEADHLDKIQLTNGMFIPCFVEDILLGFLVLGPKSNRLMYNENDTLIFEVLSNSTALAIENSQFWHEIEEHQRQVRIAEMDLFSYSVAHEIDNPMTTIKGHVDLIRKMLLRLNLPPDVLKALLESLDFIAEGQDRTTTMIKALEDYGKPVPPDLLPLKLEDVVATFLKLFVLQIKHHGITLDQEIALNLPPIRGIKQELMQVLVNFSHNSIHALLGVPQGQKRVRLKIELLSPDWIRITFSDNGYGIDPEQMISIFAPFTTTKASTEGRGMGLFTVRRIIEKHHGRVWAESPGKGKGASLIVELPVAKDVTEEDFKKKDKGRRLF
jgi:signal transduction histidine kinase